MQGNITKQQIDIVEKIRMSYEIINKKQIANKLLNSSSTGINNFSANIMKSMEDEIMTMGNGDNDEGDQCIITTGQDWNVGRTQESMLKLAKSGK